MHSSQKVCHAFPVDFSPVLYCPVYIYVYMLPGGNPRDHPWLAHHTNHQRFMLDPLGKMPPRLDTASPGTK